MGKGHGQAQPTPASASAKAGLARGWVAQASTPARVLGTLACATAVPTSQGPRLMIDHGCRIATGASVR
ncbi:hypothetical protein TIFTF001_041402 [Ficus carica]|uniref:Uncharacterized protein n=1 Tax=Ficus carica TaxID=3494 RepID=A0AA87ZE80_FICCA|nr:hypothetical protein TIFTF001_050286 [Ficus carica]GMN30075.1 hypothetical protein TIFTF001_041402 [Ficus carica]